MDRKELFKYLIKEFQELELPPVFLRDLVIPTTNKIVTLVGPRRSGKTFYFYQIIKNLAVPKNRILYLNFEDDRILPLDVKELDSLLEAYYELYPQNKSEQIYLFFDEIQNIPLWELYLRRIYDKEKVKIFITGSNSKLLSQEIATHLRGRTLVFYISVLSFKEFLRFKGLQVDLHSAYSKDRFQIKKLFEQYLTLGGFPEVALEKANLEREILSNYYEIMIYKDIVDRFSVRNTLLLKSLSKFLLTNIASPFSVNAYYTSLKNTTAIGKETLFEYIAHLEDASMVFLVSLFSYSLKIQQVNPRKVYCIDNGLRNVVSFTFSADEGRLAENLVGIELRRKQQEFYYWRNKGEVDFIVKNKDRSMSAINVTYTNEIPNREVESLQEFKQFSKSKIKELLILTRDLEKQEQGIRYIPLWKWLLQNAL